MFKAYVNSIFNTSENEYPQFRAGHKYVPVISIILRTKIQHCNIYV